MDGRKFKWGPSFCTDPFFIMHQIGSSFIVIVTPLHPLPKGLWNILSSILYLMLSY